MTSIEYLFNELWEAQKDKLTWHSILEKAKEMHKQQLPQQEILDEDIENQAKECVLEDLITSRDSFVLGAKWYREQLKQRQCKD